jgi:hypothetical protein
MGEKTDRALRSLKERMNGRTKLTLGLGSVGAALWLALQQGWVAVAFETTAHAAATYETREHAEAMYETRSDAGLARLRMQAQLDHIEEEHTDQMRTIKLLQLDLVRLLVRLGVQPATPEDE